MGAVIHLLLSALMGTVFVWTTAEQIPVNDSVGLSRRSIDSHSRRIGVSFLMGICIDCRSYTPLSAGRMSCAVKPKQILIGLSGKPPVRPIIYERLKKTVVFCDAVPFFYKKSPLAFQYVPFCVKNSQLAGGVVQHLFCDVVSCLEKVWFSVQCAPFMASERGQREGLDLVLPCPRNSM